MRRFPLFFALLLLLMIPFRAGIAAAQADQTTGTRKIVNKVVPGYPAMARSLNLSGTVKLEVLVLANGTVKSINVKGGNPLLVQAAQTAVHDWKWEKTEHDSTELVEFRFNP